MFGFQQKKIMIAGAAGGIGSETARVLSQYGAILVLVDCDKEQLSQLCLQLDGEGHSCYFCDFREIDSIDSLINKVVDEQGPIDGFVNCAGISSRKPLNVLKHGGFSKLMDINFYAFVELVKSLTKKGRFADGGSIVVMSSISSIRGYKAKTEYCVSKAAVDAFVRCMALELAAKKIRINSIMPGEVLTPMGAKSREMAKLAGTVIEEAPLGPTEPAEVANLIAFLLSDATKTITGTSIRIDGGMSV